MSSQSSALPGAAKNGPETVWEDIPTEGITDPRWEAFEARYRDYVQACIREKDPVCEFAAPDIMMRFRTFFAHVLPKYKYRPEIERFRVFIRRFVFATVEHVRLTRTGVMPDWEKEFEVTQKSCDSDLNDTFDSLEDLVSEIAVEVALASYNLSDDQRYIFKAIVVEHCSEAVLNERYGAEKVAREYAFALQICKEIFRDIESHMCDYFGAA